MSSLAGRAGRATELAALCGTLALAAIAAAIPGLDRMSAPKAVPIAGSYPPARRIDHVDVYHGTEVADPYRWMEDLDSPELAAWVEAQNALTGQFISALPGREHFRRRIRELLDYERIGLPDREGGVYAYLHNPGTADQDSLWVTTDPAESGRKVVDPLAIRADGTVSIGSFSLSPDGQRLAYSLSDGGTDWKTWHVRDLATDRETDVLDGTKFTGVSWLRDASGFVYSRYPRAGEGYDDSRQVAIHLHRIGSDAATDPLVFAIDDHPRREPYGLISEDGRFLVISVREGYETNGLYYRRLDGTPEQLLSGPVVRLFDDWTARYDYIGNEGDVFYILTTRDAPRGRVVAVDLAHPEPSHWRTVVPEQTETIEAAAFIGGRILVQAVRDAHAVAWIIDPAGGELTEIPLPGRGSVTGFAGTADQPEAFFSYTDFTTPRTVYRLDVRQPQPAPVRVPRAAVDPGSFVTEQVFATSRDGTKVPLYIVRRRDLPPGPRPTVLYGYGGFNVSLLPGFSAARMAWIEAGGIYAQANLRGGGEYGEAWHQAGTRLRKQNVFDDFIASAEWLISAGHTSPQQLAIWGGSNGGLLVAAVAHQRPDLFAAVVPAVGVLDMLRYQEASLNARQWSSDYGLSENPEEFRALHAYSPYHNALGRHCYPAMLIQADAHDDRVVAWHSYKYAAAAQAGQTCERPVLLRVETRSGHGAGASVTKVVEEYADQWTFVAAVLGLPIDGESRAAGRR